MSKPFVAILMGSESDLSIMQAGADILKQLEIDYEIKITSAHRTPAVTQQYISDAEARGCQVFIAGAGLAAHLAGATAAHTAKPVSVCQLMQVLCKVWTLCCQQCRCPEEFLLQLLQ